MRWCLSIEQGGGCFLRVGTGKMFAIVKSLHECMEAYTNIVSILTLPVMRPVGNSVHSSENSSLIDVTCYQNPQNDCPCLNSKDMFHCFTLLEACATHQASTRSAPTSQAILHRLSLRELRPTSGGRGCGRRDVPWAKRRATGPGRCPSIYWSKGSKGSKPGWARMGASFGRTGPLSLCGHGERCEGPRMGLTKTAIDEGFWGVCLCVLRVHHLWELLGGLLV